MFDVLPGRCKHIPKLQPGLQPTDGFDSHASANHLEYDALHLPLTCNDFVALVRRWFLFNEDQRVPRYVLQIRAFESRRTKANDDEQDAGTGKQPEAKYPPAGDAKSPKVNTWFC